MTLSLKERMTLVLTIEELCTGIFQNGDDLVFFSWHVVSYMFVIPEWDKPGVSCTPSLIRNEPPLPRNKSATFWSNWIQ